MLGGKAVSKRNSVIGGLIARAAIVLISTIGPWVTLASATPQDTERFDLSGRGLGATVDWEFSVSAGRRAGEWTTLPVPSHWEQHGFGSYNYGHDDVKSREQGHYRHRFRVPANWQGRQIDLVFDGSMTDTEAKLNGRYVGPAHRGSFYRFRYDVTPLLRAGEDNLLEVTVRKHSADRSVNRAEREADYWVFGGIFRPVYLEARPAESIDHVAIDADHEGGLVAKVRLRGLNDRAVLHAWIESLEGKRLAATQPVAVDPAVPQAELEVQHDEAQPWSAESPQLYQLLVELRRGDQLLHRSRHRFGFRTVEVRTEGLFVNGRRVLLKGVNRHAFWPSSGRTMNRELDVRDVELIKEMNMNAVRTSHYPPDQSFLDACDELGLYVIDELAGWHDAYGSWVGRRLVREMVERDVNHPSVILWANGNEGGWNVSLDSEFALHDPQRRAVIHPDAVAGGFDTKHYLSWQELESSFDPSSLRNRWRALLGELPLVMPTEVLHGLYDGGAGAGLEDYWQRLRGSPRAAGAFLWSFTDEAIERTDRERALDTDGNHAPDGVLGPYRERSGSFYAVREIFSPIQLITERFQGSVELENQFTATNLAQCSFDWSLLDLPGPAARGEVRLVDSGSLPGPDVDPGGRGNLELPAGVDWPAVDAVRWTARDVAGRDVGSWVLPIRDLRREIALLSEPETGEPVVSRVIGNVLELRAGTTGAEFDLTNGELLSLLHRDGRVRLSRGPRLTGSDAIGESRARYALEGNTAVVEVDYAAGGPVAGDDIAGDDIAGRRVAGRPVAGRPVAGRPVAGDDIAGRRVAGGEDRLQSARWTLFPSGWLRLSVRYVAEGPREIFGFGFDYPQDQIESFRWLGGGPTRVWKNRRAGALLGVWEKSAGVPTPAAPHELDLAGFYDSVTWAELESREGRLVLALESPGLYLSLFSPTFPDDARDAVAIVPAGGIQVLHGISAIGTKFHPAAELGPGSQPDVATGTYHAVVWLRADPQ